MVRKEIGITFMLVGYALIASGIYRIVKDT